VVFPDPGTTGVEQVSRPAEPAFEAASVTYCLGGPGVEAGTNAGLQTWRSAPPSESRCWENCVALALRPPSNAHRGAGEPRGWRFVIPIRSVELADLSAPCGGGSVTVPGWTVASMER
jgi:hypothetical protein